MGTVSRVYSYAFTHTNRFRQPTGTFHLRNRGQLDKGHRRGVGIRTGEQCWDSVSTGGGAEERG